MNKTLTEMICDLEEKVERIEQKQIYQMCLFLIWVILVLTFLVCNI